MLGPVESHDSTLITSFLKAEFQLNTPGQVTQIKCQTFGFSSTQYKFKVTDNLGVVYDLFVKKVCQEKNKVHKYMDKELGMFNEILPSVRKFIESHDVELAGELSSCFVKYYGFFRDDVSDQEFLIIEDFSASDKNFVYRNEPEVIVKKLGLVAGSFYSWQQQQHKGFSYSEMLEKYDYLTELYTSEVDDLNETFFSTLSTALYRIIRTNPEHIEVLAEEQMTEKLNRIVKLSPLLARIRHEIQKPPPDFFCLTLGDVHRGNIALSRDITQVLFYDFGLIRLASPLIDFHHYTAASLQVTVQDKASLTDQLYKIYMESFVKTCSSLEINITDDFLKLEYDRTISWRTITSYFVVLLTLTIQGTPQTDEDQFVALINSLDIGKDRDRIREIVRSMGHPAEALQNNLIDFLKFVDMGDIEDLEKLSRLLNLEAFSPEIDCLFNPVY